MKTGTNWTYNGKVVEELPEDCEAFVYLITNLIDHKKYVGKKLAKFKIPKHICFVEEIPKGATGKMQRIGLAKKLGLEAD